MIFSNLLKQNSDMMNPGGHNTNQDLILFIGLILILLIVVVLAVVIGLFYLYYTGKFSFQRNIEKKSNIEEASNEFKLPDITFTPLEKRILDTVFQGHKIKQSDHPSLLNSSKSKISEALSNLEEKRIIERFKSGRSLEIRYINEVN